MFHRDIIPQVLYMFHRDIIPQVLCGYEVLMNMYFYYF